MKSINNYVCISLGDRKDEDEFGLRKEKHGVGQSEKGILSCTSKDCNSRSQTIHIWMIF